jgi:hypothetical protein
MSPNRLEKIVVILNPRSPLIAVLLCFLCCTKAEAAEVGGERKEVFLAKSILAGCRGKIRRRRVPPGISYRNRFVSC